MKQSESNRNNTCSGSLPMGILTGLCALFCFMGIGLTIAIFVRQIYYMDMTLLNIPEKSGFSEEQILLNYNALIDWCSPFVNEPFDLPTFAYSEGGAIHFQQVKVVFNIFLSLGAVGLIALVPLLYRARKAKDGLCFKTAGIVAITVPMALGAFAAIDFNRAFIMFHDIVFRNDLWIFDWRTDPIILILPETYFMHCAIVILVVVFLGALGLLFVGRKQELC